MSRLDSMLDLDSILGMPAMSLGGRSARYPAMPPAQVDSLLSQIGRSTIGGLQYVGETLDKPGRAVRGTLSGLTGGEWGGSLLNLIPFSDTLGITDPQEGIGGRDLLEQWNVLPENQPGFFNSVGDSLGDVAGFAAEVALDPLTYLGIAPLTQLGKDAKAAGTLARGIGPGIAAKERALMSVGLPFTHGVELGTGPMAKAAGTKLDDAIDFLRFQNPVGRKLGEWFDPTVMGRKTEKAQRYASEVMYPAIRQNMAKERMAVTPYVREAADAGVLDDPSAVRVMRAALEPKHAAANFIGPPPPPTYTPWTNPAQQGLGLGVTPPKLFGRPKLIQDEMDNWFQRTKDPFGPSPEELATWNRGIDIAEKIHPAIAPPPPPPRYTLDPGLSVQLDNLASVPINPRTGAATSLQVNNTPDFTDLYMRSQDWSTFDDITGKRVKVPSAMVVAKLEAANKGVGAYRALHDQLAKYGRPVVVESVGPESFKEQLRHMGYQDLGNNFVYWNRPKTPVGLPSVEEAQALGLKVGDLVDDFGSYWPRYMHQTQDSGIMGMARQIRDAFRGPADPVQLARDPALKNIPGVTNKVNDLVSNRAYSSFKRTTGPRKMLNALADELYGTEFNLLDTATQKQIRRLSQKLKRMPERYSDPANPQALFNADPITDLGIRKELNARALTTADKTLDFLADGGIAKQMPDKISRGQVYMDSAGKKWVGMRDVLSRAGIGNRVRNPDTFAYTGVGGPEELARRMNLTSVKELDRMAIPADIANDVIGYLRSGSAKETSNITRAYDQLSNLFRRTQTTPFPAFHARNLFSGLYYNSAANATDPRYPRFGKGLVQPNLDMANLLAGKPIDLPNKGLGVILDEAGVPITDPVKLLDEMTAMGAIRRGVHTTETTQGFSGASKLIEQMPFKERAAQALSRTKDPVKLGTELGTHIEDLVRGAHYLAKRRHGYTPQAALDSVLNWHFDYSAAGTTPFERQVVKRAIPFYTFAKNNTPLVLSQLMHHPGGQEAQTIRAILEGQPGPEEEGFIPGYLREQGAIPVGPEEDGNRTYISGFGLPIEEPFGRVKMGPGGLGRSIESVLGMTNPVIKAPLEMLAGRQFFSGRDLDTLDPPLARTITNAIELVGGPQVDPASVPIPQWVEQAVSNLPGSRAVMTARQLVDPRKWESPGDVAGLFGNLATGVRTTDVDTAKARQEAIDVLEQMLLASPNVKETNRPYIPRDRQQAMTPEEAALYRLYLSSQR